MIPEPVAAGLEVIEGYILIRLHFEVCNQIKRHVVLVTKVYKDHESVG
jgi:hypothetical protein